MNGEALREMTNFGTQEELLQATDSHGTQCLCFRTRCDVRLGTAPARVQWKASSGKSSQPSTSQPSASQPSDGADAPAADCQFEIVKAKACLVAMFDDVDRPCIKKILRLDVF